MPLLAPQSKAPDFTLPDQDGVERRLSDYAGQWVLLYFYPKDDTPGCTKEACTIGSAFPDFAKLGVQVLGVSKDSVKSHKKFAEKYNLPFTLLSDADKKVVEAYGVWQEKKFMGRAYMGIARVSYLIDPTGKVARVYPTVVPQDHAAEVLKDLTELV